MNIVLGIATMVMMAVIIYLNVRLNNHEADTNLEIEDLKTKYDRIEKLDEAIDNGLDLAEMQIKEITARLEEITADIHRIDHDETEIRKYYINYRMPSHPNGGVPWAKDIKCNEETENE